jgi:homoserine O-acetyltransferase
MASLLHHIQHHSVTIAAPLPLDSGQLLSSVTIAYQTYGTLNAEKSNAILVCHALTGDQHVASRNPITGKGGWWTAMIGPGKPIDTDRFFVICANVLAGCTGTTGPASTNPETGSPGHAFPVVTIATWCARRRCCSIHLGIDTLSCVVGGSMGGMQALQWAASYPERVFSALPSATAQSIRRRTSPSTRLGGRRSWPIPTGAAALFEEGTRPAKGSPSRAWRAHHLSLRSRRCTANSAASCRTREARPSASTPISRSKAICGIRG